jgi:hypothetical protein
MSAAAATRARPDKDILKNRFASHAVSGHAAIPEHSANQPFVNGQGPLSISNITPPPPANMVHAQAKMRPALASHTSRRSVRDRALSVSVIKGLDCVQGLIGWAFESGGRVPRQRLKLSGFGRDSSCKIA